MWLLALTFFTSLTKQLTLLVRQTAWLNAIPEKSKRPRRETTSRELPPIEGGGYLIDILFEIGPIKPAGMGAQIGIEETDLLAWQQNQQVALYPWEAKLIRLLSREYAAMAMEARDPLCSAPYIGNGELTEQQRKKISSAMSNWANKINLAKQ